MDRLDVFSSPVGQPVDMQELRRSSAEVGQALTCNCDCADNRDFIAEMRQRLTLLSIQVKDGKSQVDEELQIACRRIAYLEAALPDLRMQNSRLQQVEQEVKVVGDIVGQLLIENN